MVDQSFYRQHNIRPDNNIQNSTQINKFRVSFPSSSFGGGLGIVFFTKPDLNIFKSGSNGTEFESQISNQGEFIQLVNTKQYLFKELQMNNGNGPFIHTLGNFIQNFPITDEIIKTRDSAETANDWRVVYGHRINDSRSANTIDFTFKDNRNLDVYDLIKIWVNYINLVSIGRLSPSKNNKKKRILDYAGSIYFFLLDESFTNIKYYCKLIGAFPLNIPSSAFSWDLGQKRMLEYNITFQYSQKDERPYVIQDFNKICGANKSYFTPLVDDYGMMGSTWASNAFIENVNGQLKLRFN